MTRTGRKSDDAKALVSRNVSALLGDGDGGGGGITFPLPREKDRFVAGLGFVRGAILILCFLDSFGELLDQC